MKNSAMFYKVCVQNVVDIMNGADSYSVNHIIITLLTREEIRQYQLQLPENPNRLDHLVVPVGDNHYDFTDNHAMDVLDFTEKWKHKAAYVIVHCAAGRSRSPGCAAALSKIYFGDDQYWYDHYTPNNTVYSHIIREGFRRNML